MTSPNKDIILHLIAEDLKYFRMIYGLHRYDVHIEFYPDIASAVFKLLGVSDELNSEKLHDLYNRYMAKCRAVDFANDRQIELWAEECYEALVSGC